MIRILVVFDCVVCVDGVVGPILSVVAKVVVVASEKVAWAKDVSRAVSIVEADGVEMLVVGMTSSVVTGTSDFASVFGVSVAMTSGNLGTLVVTVGSAVSILTSSVWVKIVDSVVVFDEIVSPVIDPIVDSLLVTGFIEDISVVSASIVLVDTLDVSLVTCDDLSSFLVVEVKMLKGSNVIKVASVVFREDDLVVDATGATVVSVLVSDDIEDLSVVKPSVLT